MYSNEVSGGQKMKKMVLVLCLIKNILIFSRVPENDVLRQRPAATRRECLHQQTTAATPDYHCHLGARQIVSIFSQ